MGCSKIQRNNGGNSIEYAPAAISRQARQQKTVIRQHPINGSGLSSNHIEMATGKSIDNAQRSIHQVSRQNDSQIILRLMFAQERIQMHQK
jgi:hypothetical protein